MAVAVTVTKKWYDGKKLFVLGTLTFSGSYTTGGDGLSFTGLGIQSSLAPDIVWVGGTAGYGYGYVPGSPASQSNGKVKISTTAATELAAGAYPAGITGDANIIFESSFTLR